MTTKLKGKKPKLQLRHSQPLMVRMSRTENELRPLENLLKIEQILEQILDRQAISRYTQPRCTRVAVVMMSRF